MDNNLPTPSLSSQEKLAASLASFVFFMPLLMNQNTGFTVKYMKQAFLINLIECIALIFSSLFFFISGILQLVTFILFLTSCFLALQAFTGKDFVITFLYENAEKLIQSIGIGSWFVPKK